MEKGKIDKLVELMESIEYGYVDKDGNKHFTIDENFPLDYKLQSPLELKKSKLGVCWDQVELERDFLEGNQIDCNTYFIVYYSDSKCPTHTFITYKNDNKYIWFENAWEKQKGIHSYESINELLFDVRKKFITFEAIDNIDCDNMFIYKYGKPNYNISCLDFYKHCENSVNISLD